MYTQDLHVYNKKKTIIECLRKALLISNYY